MERKEKDNSILKGNITALIAAFCAENDIESLKDASQSEWDACLQYTGRQLFATPKYFHAKSVLLQDLDRLSFVLDMYIYLCSVYDKVPSIISFSYLTCIDYTTFMQWLNNSSNTIYSSMDDSTCSNNNYMDTDSSISSSDYIGDIVSGNDRKYLLIKRLYDIKEHSLTNKLIDGKSKNVVGIIATLNRSYGWDKKTDPGEAHPAAISADSIRASLGIKPLELSDNSNNNNGN